MSPVILAAIGLALGALAAASHLAVVGLRARLVVSGRPGVALWTFPLGLIGPALCVAAAIAAGSVAAYSLLPGLIAARQLIIHRAKEA